MAAHKVDVRIITLKDVAAKDEPKFDAIRRLFPTLETTRGVDVRQSTPEELAKLKLITPNAMDTLQRGRKHHKELSSLGAVGVAQANLAALSEGNAPLLLLEEDAVLDPRVVSEVEELLERESQFDCAVFGAYLLDGSTKHARPVTGLPGWYHHPADASFILLHCVLYSRRGRAFARELLRKPLDIQIDAQLSLAARMGEMRVWLQLSSHSARQALHLSSIQETQGSCALCSIPSHTAVTKLTHCLLIVSVLVLLLVFGQHARRTDR